MLLTTVYPAAPTIHGVLRGVVTIHQGHCLVGLHLQESGTISEGQSTITATPPLELAEVSAGQQTPQQPLLSCFSLMVPFLHFCQRTPCGFSSLHEYIDNNKQLIDIAKNSSKHAYPRKSTYLHGLETTSKPRHTTMLTHPSRLLTTMAHRLSNPRHTSTA